MRKYSSRILRENEDFIKDTYRDYILESHSISTPQKLRAIKMLSNFDIELLAEAVDDKLEKIKKQLKSPHVPYSPWGKGALLGMLALSGGILGVLAYPLIKLMGQKIHACEKFEKKGDILRFKLCKAMFLKSVLPKIAALKTSATKKYKDKPEKLKATVARIQKTYDRYAKQLDKLEKEIAKLKQKSAKK